mmetsp:Transcript_30980/g.78492  ORF Transcript_30980/g.78492 Transcript_30980/m.78492 type:complete len:297 (-) Transcript_30980:64-954(-)
MRRAVKCAAANDEEDVGGALDERGTKRPRKGVSASSREAAKQDAPKKKKKEKEFAWMDSEDEDEDEDVAELAHKEEAEDDENEEVTLEKLEAVHSFGRMVMLSDSLGKTLKAGSLGPNECAAACRALARAKFFDNDLLEGLCGCLPRMIEGNRLSVEQAHDAVECMKELNFYNKELFSSIAKTFKQKVSTMAGGMRVVWFEAMQGLGHKKDLDFQQLLQMPPVPPGSPNYRTIRCAFFAKGGCELGALCTYAHNMHAPISLTDAAKEDGWRMRSVMLTQDQMYSVGNDAYASAGLR